MQKKNVQIREYEILQNLGSGSFGSVELGRHKTEEKYYAIKMINKQALKGGQALKQTINEVQILKQLKSNFFVQFKEEIQDDFNIYLVMEFISGGEIYKLLKQERIFKESYVQFYSAQILMMIEKLHSVSVIYRDLKPENILINSNGYLKLIDFGLSKQTQNRQYTICGTPEYLAPEMLLQQGHDKAVDWWCMGILIYEMSVGITPFDSEEPIDIYKNILNKKIKFPSHISGAAKNLIQELLQKNPKNRLGCLKKGSQDIKGHRFYNRMEWDLLEEQKIKPVYIPNSQNEEQAKIFKHLDSVDSNFSGLSYQQIILRYFIRLNNNVKTQVNQCMKYYRQGF